MHWNRTLAINLLAVSLALPAAGRERAARDTRRSGDSVKATTADRKAVDRVDGHARRGYRSHHRRRYDRGHHGRHHDRPRHRHGHHHYRSYYRPHHSHYSYHHYGPGWGVGLAIAGAALAYNVSHHHSYHHGAVHHHSRSSYGRDEQYAEIETDVKPSSATVYVDGYAVGIADDFNGWPGKLRVEPGYHEIEFREPGYDTMVVEVDVLPYHTVRVRERMRRASYGSSRPTATYSRPSTGSSSRPPSSRPSSRPARTGSGLILDVWPPDATVYVDGQLISPDGSGGPHYELDLAPGSHRVEVAKPGFHVFFGDVILRERHRQQLDVRLDPIE